MRGVPGVRGNPGHLSVRLYSLRGATTAKAAPSSHASIPNKNGDYGFQLASAAVDLRSGKVSVAADTDDVVQNLCLAFSVAVLYVLCQPRPAQNAASQQRNVKEPAKPLKEVTKASST